MIHLDLIRLLKLSLFIVTVNIDLLPNIYFKRNYSAYIVTMLILTSSLYLSRINNIYLKCVVTAVKHNGHYQYIKEVLLWATEMIYLNRTKYSLEVKLVKLVIYNNIWFKRKLCCRSDHYHNSYNYALKFRNRWPLARFEPCNHTGISHTCNHVSYHEIHTIKITY